MNWKQNNHLPSPIALAVLALLATQPYVASAQESFTPFQFKVASNQTLPHQQQTNYWREPSIPTGVGYEQTVDEPALHGGVSVVDGDIPNTNSKNNTVAYNPNINPILQILAGFDRIWTAGNAVWASDGSNNLTAYDGDSGVAGGATHSTSEAIVFDYANARILNRKVWQENFDYVHSLKRPQAKHADVVRELRTSQMNAYLDDQRDKGYSLISGLGTLAQDYKTGANASSDYSLTDSGNSDYAFSQSDEVIVDGTTVDIFTKQKLLNSSLADSGDYGDTDSTLASVVTLLNTVRDYGASSEAPKYHFQSPRPWRLSARTYQVPTFDTTSASALTKRTCYDLESNSVVKYFEQPHHPIVTPLTGLLCAGKNVYVQTDDDSYANDGYDTTNADSAYNGSGDWVSARAKDGAFPSGHTAEAYDRGLTYAYAIPERFAEMVARAGDLGENRIVAGMHSPLDVIGGRIMGLAVTAAMLNDPDNASVISTAVDDAHRYFLTKAKAAGFASVYAFAHSGTLFTDPYADHQAFKNQYRHYMTYGFSPLNEAKLAPQVPKGAEILLASRQPYLSDEQRRAVLATTEIASNYPVIDSSRGWGRINLVDAADGYGAFNGDVNVNMNGADGGFSALDHWRNDISGAGRLVKSGSGTLYLDGNNSYQGGTILQAGQLVATTPTALGSNTVYQQGGDLNIAIANNLAHSGTTLSVANYVIKSGSLILDLRSSCALDAQQMVYIDGGALQLQVPTLHKVRSYQIISANHLEGKFTSAKASDASGQSYKVTLFYSQQGVIATVTPRATL